MGFVLDKFFKLKDRGTRVRTELAAGLATFATMSYIIFLQPAIMSGRMFGFETGMDFGALLTGTCIAAAFGSILMGLLANYPIALAPGMGENFFFVLTALPLCAAAVGMKVGADAAWQLGLGVVFVSGVLFAILSFCNVRTLLMTAISPSMKAALGAGIGLFIAFIGLRNGGIVNIVNNNLSMNIKLGATPETVFLIGLAITGGLTLLRVKSAILFGILGSALVAALFGLIKFNGFFAPPPSPLPVFAKMDILGVFKYFVELLPLLIIFLYMDVFDTMGTLVGVGTRAGLMKNGTLENAERAFASDALGTVAGSVCGHSTVTAFIESAAGVEQGGRTGLTAVFAGAFFLLTLFISPFVSAVSGCAAIAAPALVIVGAMMMKSVVDVKWDDASEAIPSFLVIIGIPFCYSIGDGMILGFVLYPLIKLVGGKAKETGWLSITLAVVLILYLLVRK
jgi:adenine/guanine/hypoxanthine permease